MTDGTKIALAILACGVLVAGVLLWQGRLGSHASAPPTSTPVAPVAISATATFSPKKDPMGGVLTNQEFMPLWEAGPAEKARTECYEPAEKRGPAESVLHFTVKIRASGEVADVSWVARGPGDDELHECVSGVIRSMRFAARGEAAEGVVQAAKPGAFKIGDALPPARDR